MTEHGMILVTGATGYVGARLVTRLLAKGYRVRATGRSLARLRKRPWANHPGVDLCPVTILRAAMILGAGSASFEILRSSRKAASSLTPSG